MNEESYYFTLKNFKSVDFVDAKTGKTVFTAEPMKTCWDCMQRIGEECGITGKEVYPDTEICSSFEES